jgi:hypothetical protein
VTSLLLGPDAGVAVALSSSESWRQYVPVVVIGLVLIDILLGSPVASSVLNKALPPTDSESRGFSKGTTEAEGGPSEATASPAATALGSPSRSSSRPRIDVDAFAKAALERAEGVTQLRDYLESRKTDYDRMEDMKREMDRKMEELDRKNRVQGDGET